MLSSSKIDMIGQKIGKLTILEQVESKITGYSVRARYKCQCDCGKITITSGTVLRIGKTKSCGCLVRDTARKSPREAGLNHIFTSYKNKAKKKNREFLLTKEEFKILTQKQCHYCGAKPSLKSTPHKSVRNQAGREYKSFIYNGVDRVDNNLGYISNNVVSCCKTCNYAKHTGSVENLIKHALDIQLTQRLLEQTLADILDRYPDCGA